MTAYPTVLTFDLAGRRRQMVLEVAAALALDVTHDQRGTFTVVVADPLLAYRFGWQCGVAGLIPTGITKDRTGGDDEW